MKFLVTVTIIAALVILASCSGTPSSEALLPTDDSIGGSSKTSSMAKGDQKDAKPAISPSESTSQSMEPSPASAAEKSSMKVEEPMGAAMEDAELAMPAPAQEPPASQAPEALYLSADDSNSAASPAIARKLIRARKYVPPGIIRTYEYLNYHTFSYDPIPGELIAIYASMRKTDEDRTYSLQIALRGPDRNPADLPPMNMTFLVDVSGSMAGAPIERAKRIISGITGNLREEDSVSIVTFARTADVLMSGKKIGQLSLPMLVPDDVTDLDNGLEAAYAVAARNYDSRALNRVILLSDGGANAGALGLDTIARHGEDSDQQGIYLAAVGLGEGFNDSLMNALTDRGRGAYLFADSDEEVDRIVAASSFAAHFDLAVKDVRLKLLMPTGWEMEEFHGEQISTVASEVTPQYLSPNDQMIYHMTVTYTLDGQPPDTDLFEFEAEYRPIGGKAETTARTMPLRELLQPDRNILKGDAVVAVAEALKEIEFPLESHVDQNIRTIDNASAFLSEAQRQLDDGEIEELIGLLEIYRSTARYGEQAPGSRDRDATDPASVLGISANTVKKVMIVGDNPQLAIRALPRLLESVRLKPMEGFKFLALSSGPVGNTSPAGSGELSGKQYGDPAPRYMGWKRAVGESQPAYDLHQVVLELEAPSNARSIAFDFNFFSAEYPDYINQSFNDTFYAILEADSTNNGEPTNISFDSEGNSIEVDSNYFQKPYHPIPNTGTGFDYHGSTGWLRTAWPINGGERFRLTFSIHDEGDAIYDSLVVLDNFRFLEYGATGTTDPLN